SLRLPQPKAIDRSVKSSEDHLVAGNRKPCLVQERGDLLSARIEFLSRRAVEGIELCRDRELDALLGTKQTANRVVGLSREFTACQDKYHAIDNHRWFRGHHVT